MTLSGKERAKKHREKRNRDPERREEALKKDRERKQRKKSKMTSEQKEEHRERNRLNVQRHRAKKRVIENYYHHPTIAQHLVSTDDFQDAGAVNLDHPSQSCPKKNRLQPATTGGELSKFLKPDDEGVRIAADKCETDTLQGTVSSIVEFMMTKLEDFHEIMKKILGETSFADAEESDIQEALKKTFHNLPDWNGGKCSRRGKKQCDPGEVATTSRVKMKNPSVQTSDRNGESDTNDEGDADDESDADDEGDTDDESDANDEGDTDDESDANDEGDADDANDESIDFETEMWSSLDQDTTHEKVNTLMEDSKFREAIPLLKEHPVTEVQQMKLLECYIEVGEDTKISAVVENMIKLMTQNPHRKAKDILDFGEKYRRSGSYMNAITCFACAGKMYLRESKSDESVFGIFACVDDCSKAISPMIRENERMRDLVRSLGMKTIYGFIDDLLSVENADPDEKVDRAAGCLLHTGLLYAEMGNFDEMMECYGRGIDIMMKHFGLNSPKYSIYGLLHENMGDVFRVSGNVSKARGLYHQAISAYEQAEDLTDDGERKSYIEKVEEKLNKMT